MLKFQQKEEKMKKYLKILKDCELFRGIADEDLLRMLTCFGARIEFFDKKYTVMAEGSAAKYIGIVLTGAVNTVQVDYYGNRSILGSVSAGELFSSAFACAGVESMPVSIVASEPSEIMLVDCGHIMHTCSNNCGFHQTLIYNLMKDMAQKVIAFHERIEVTSKRTTRERLLSYLALCAKKAGTDSFDIPFDRQELADYLEVDRSGLSAEISKLRAEGVLESSKRHFRLL
jgi:CRP-like cAMP-binding protein